MDHTHNVAVSTRRDPLVYAPMEESEEALEALDKAIAYRHALVEILRREIRDLEGFRHELSAALARPA